MWERGDSFVKVIVGCVYVRNLVWPKTNLIWTKCVSMKSELAFYRGRVQKYSKRMEKCFYF